MNVRRPRRDAPGAGTVRGVAEERPRPRDAYRPNPAGARKGALALAAMLAMLPAVAGAVTKQAVPVPFQDPLDTPATPDARATHETLLAVAPAGRRIVAVGLRGLALWTDDRGAHWTQAAVPVQSDLVSVFFLDDHRGWATGQGGVILHTEDAGASWTKQFDGRQDAAFTAYYQKRAAAGDAAAAPFVKLMTLNTAHGAILPYLGVAFTDAQHGFAVGSYGMLAATEDGGAHWEPWLDRIDDPQALNLSAISVIAGHVWISGEGGQVYELDPSGQHFSRHDTGYAGSLFGITGDARTLVAFGLLGNAFRSADDGRTWQKIDTGSGTSIAGGTTLPDGRVVLGTQNGQLLVGAAQAGPLHPAAGAGGFPYADVAALPGGGLALAGLGGIAVAPVP